VAVAGDNARTDVDSGELALFNDALQAPQRGAGDSSFPCDGPHRSNGGRARLTLGEAARIIREAVKNKSYRKTPLGQLVGRYLRWFRNEYGATDSTIRDYEAVLARMSLLLADREPLEVSTEDLREVIDTWAMRHARTRAKVTSVIRAFWGVGRGGGPRPLLPRLEDPAPAGPAEDGAAPARPRRRVALGCTRIARDRLALLVLLDCGIRRAELAGIWIRDFDLSRSQLTVFGKGQKERVIPLRGRIVMALRAYLGEPLEFIGRWPEPDYYLLTPRSARLTGTSTGPTRRSLARQTRFHRWWYRMLEQAGLVGHGVRSGLNMHRARHTFATELRRVAGVEAASQALGHSDLSTTLGIYGHQDQRDLERAMEAFARAREAEEQEAASRGNDSPSRLD